MPFNHAEDTRQLIALAEFLNRAFQHPEVAVVIDEDDLAVAVVPKPQHGIDQHLLDRFFGHDDRARHADVVVRVPAVVERRERKVDLLALLFRVSADAFENLRAHEGVEARVGVHAVVFRAADGHEHDVVFAALLNLVCARRILDVRPRHAQFGRRRDTVGFQLRVELRLGHVPNRFFHAPDGRILKDDRRVFRQEPLFLFHVETSLLHRKTFFFVGKKMVVC
ncbi:hypothetical protein SDC9_60860 [bioreactor metagenome]|uniref:Uncharacterized protein n=1 Tax=bioreactor metagenome TaxID=1076179 RepID=A0A644XE47_9ZZZZ